MLKEISKSRRMMKVSCFSIVFLIAQPLVHAESHSAVALSTYKSTLDKDKFDIDRPFDANLCADMKRPFCRNIKFTDDLRRLKYRIAPLDGLPISTNRSPSYWKKISERKKNEYLSITLWNFVAKMGVIGGKQYRTDAQILADFKYVKSLTTWYIERVRSGAPIVSVLNSIRDSLREDAAEEWVIDWFINGVIHVALPALAPSLITKTDASIRYQN